MRQKINSIKQWFSGERGFTLIETFMAISILLIALVGPLTLAKQGVASAVQVKDQVTATYLAQEAIEYVRYRRDTNGLKEQITATAWLTNIYPVCESSCLIDVERDLFEPCTPGSGTCKLYRNPSNGFYTHQSSGMQATPYTRYVTVSPVSGTTDEVIVTAVVQWNSRAGQRTVRTTEHMRNWQRGSYAPLLTEVAPVKSTGSANNTRGFSYSHTVPSNNNKRILIVAVQSEDDFTFDCSLPPGSVTYGGRMLTRIDEQITGYYNSGIVGAQQIYGCASLWYLLDANFPSGTTNSVLIRTNGSRIVNSMSSGAFTLLNAEQQGPERSAKSGVTNAYTIRTPITTVTADSIIVDSFIEGRAQANNYTAGPGQTILYGFKTGGTMYGASSYKETTTENTATQMDWSFYSGQTGTEAWRMSHVVASFAPHID